ncbi:DEAD/DEAH box helicase [Mucilaginibacter sp. OK098]|uniref:DEAD/DEAH box helicase n=1 Tax=Mucilaginibacter sp. OK098 TaxID=1855297 RepID=UPI000920357D|nr:DEAD/DEAH box helicase [Mucilaginibacter sp. OK098]SHN25755.1 Helicase conserved C-terminal domain-containing protein [Mucilaginibacter sp. OK098]
MQFELGIYEQLITKLIANQLSLLNGDNFFIKSTVLDKEEASRYLSLYLAETIKFALNEIKDENKTLRQVELSNKLIQVLIDELPKLGLSNNLIYNEGKILEAVFSKLDSPYPDLNERLKQITPYTRLSQSELFTGSNSGITLESEIKKEILSADEICWLVSFIKFSGIRIFKEELEEFTNSGKRLKIITTTYMGATDVKAVEFLSNLKNTEIKVSYNSEHERLHAKAYLFLRNTGFNTGYIGSSNISRSALTNGLEWNLKVTAKEIGHIIDKFKKTFDTYWADKDFEFYESGQDKQKLKKALKQNSHYKEGISTFFDLKPFPYQEEILEKLKSERIVHNRYKNLVVAATGTGKTVISSFDYKYFKDNQPRARLLFVAHRKEILEQAQTTFKHVLRNANFGALWVDGEEPDSYEFVFASVQTINNRISQLALSEDFFDFIIIDEVHHIAASSYRPILEKFKPKILLGLTATPERSDGDDILNDFCGVIAAEIRLPEALNRKLLSPFQYFALSDNVDLSKLSWKNGKYEINELTKLYTEDDRRIGDILINCEKYLTDVNDVIALGFCVSQEHARYMAEKFTLAGLKADYLTSNSPGDRTELREKLRNKEINYLFVRDIFNEGVDIPEIDTVLFLRPTESLTIFLQQLGRGLRLAPNKDCLTVLDFVGNARPEYDFAHKFRALVGKTHTSVIKEIEDEFPHLPLGCSIILEKKAKEIILKNIAAAIGFNRRQLVIKIQNFKHQSTASLTLKNFIEFQHIELQLIYKKGNWKRLCVEAGIIQDFIEPNEDEITKGIKRLLQCNSISYLQFINYLIKNNFNVDVQTEEERLMLLMLHYDIWQKEGLKAGFKSIKESMLQLAKNPLMIQEFEEVIKYLIDRIDFVEKDIQLDYPFPLKVHSRYNRDQILVALRLHEFEKSSSNREGVALNKYLNTEALFVTLKKSEKEYSPTTLYDDYAINEYLFHWQSQNATSPESPKGLSYINQEDLNKRILLFVREQNEDEFGFTMSYVFLGEANFINSSGSKPMNVEWHLNEPMPAYIWKESGKLAIG